MTKQPLDLRHQALCLGLAAVLVEPLRAVAAGYGYALAEHGSRRRDVDLIAVPWTAEARSPVALAAELRAETERLVGVAFLKPEEDTEYFWRGSPGAKPHGRLTWSFHLGAGPYIDLSVVPPTVDDEGPAMILPEWPDGSARPTTLAEFAALDPIPPMVEWRPKAED